MKQQNLEGNSSFFRIVAGYHNKLIGEKDLLLGDLQNMANANTCSEAIISKLKELSILEAKIGTIHKHFAQEAGDEQKTNQQQSKTDD